MSAQPCPAQVSTPSPTVEPARPGRVTGVDVARGVALFGMMAVHVWDAIEDGAPTPSTVVAGGRSAAMFAVVAGVSIAFLSGGRRRLQGRARGAAAAGIAVRALAIGLIGLLLGLLGTGIEVILPAYAVLFLLAVPLLGLSSAVLGLLAAAFATLGPVLLVATADGELPHLHATNPTPLTVVTEPLGLLGALFLTGPYPVVVYLAYLCAGMAVGRLDLTSRRVAAWLLGGGLTLAVVAKTVSDVLLYPLGGLDRLAATTGEDATALLWEPEQESSWWYLALSGPHAHTTLDVVHATGSALAVLGAALLLTRVPVVDRLLRPLQAAGSMTLTLYSAHILVIAVGVFDDWGLALYLFLVTGSLLFASLWRRRRAQGPLEELVGRAAGRARRAVSGSPAARVGTVDRG
ncbi:DUF418 domain-containing protein [Geodermatophilus poikilotrophus]|uniref:Heparan-alpha-glucosaminide N-acetyltransferase catalytic domain-containing protein n=1 Tax=Geodermatophilus poikilotrophus TaxID=1333667 RepID=A0A1I0AWB6_9ACTN|nr:DUF418 domain-containing protein [Geodermatophilus poikilotrophus]SES97874.1 Protein of unknown function [Geodermatophilus poikilotrophus]